MLEFEQPLLLLLLIPIGVLVFLAWRRMSLPFPGAQRYMILVSRLVLFVLIVSALAGAALSLPISRQAVVFVGDISASTSPQRAFIEQWINNAIQHKRPGDQVGIVAVGRNALVEQSVSTQIDFSQFESTPDTDYTDLAAGLRLAAAILPQNSERRIVLLSDGRQNLEDALQEAQLLQQEGIRLDVVPLPASNGPEARVDGLDAPGTLHTNERFLLHARLFSTVAQPVTLRLYLDQTLLLQRSYHLVAGEQDVTFNLIAPPAGFHTYRITMDAKLDTISQNNEAAAFVNVQGPPNVLVIEGKPGAGSNIAAAGGENSYSIGGYANTPLEETLPVSMEIPQHKDKPSIAVVLIIESLENASGVNISKEAAKGVVGLLTPRDYIGVSAASGGLVIPMQHVTSKTAIDQAIDALTPTDPQSYTVDLVAAEQALLHTNAQIKHVILLGDGDATDNYATQVLKMVSEHISVSVVGTNIGSFQDLTMMEQIAVWGKGRFYRADDPNAIPKILLDETHQAARQATINESFVPAIVVPHPILAGLGSLPQLNGYVATTPKAAAQLVLISHLDDPVLAVWQYGLGRVVAWTSDALGLWTANWLQWKDAARWWANLVTWTLPAPDSQLIVNGEVTAGNGHIIVDLPTRISPAPGVANQQQVQVKIIAPDLSQQTVTLQPSAPGRWEGNFPTTGVGAYLLRVTWQARDSANKAVSQLSTTSGLVVPYSPEFNASGTDLRFLNLLAHAGDGSILGPDNYAAAFASNLPSVHAALLITFWLFALAALLLPVDIALRRLSSLEFLVVGYRWLASHVRLGKAAQTEVNLVLNTIRTRRQERRNHVASLKPKDAPAGMLSDRSRTTQLESGKQATTTVKKEQKLPGKQQEGSMTSKLLEAKRKRGDKGKIQ